MRTHHFTLLILLAALLLTGCSALVELGQDVVGTLVIESAEGSAHGSTSVESAEPAPTAIVDPVETPLAEAHSMNIKITAGDIVVTATLIDNPTSRDFTSLLPLTLTLEDYAGIEKISYLPRALSVTGAPGASDFRAGDLAYYAPWGNLAIHHQQFGYASGLVVMGTIDSGKEALFVPGPLTVTMELVTDPS